MSTEQKAAYLIARLSVGASMLGHGVVRIPKWSVFAEGMAKKFEASLLPEALVLPYSYALVAAEFIVGLLIVIGLWLRQAAIAGGLVMATLIWGCSLIEEFGAIPSQLIHSAFFIGLLVYRSYDSFSVDGLLKK